MLSGQAVRSSYVALFHTPGVPWMAKRAAARVSANRHRWARALAAEGAPTDAVWPAATFGTDLANGMGLYRANVSSRLRRPNRRPATVPVQLIVPTSDRFVPPSLLDGLDARAPRLWRRPLAAGHWVIRSHPDDVAALIAAFPGVAGAGAVPPQAQAPDGRL